MDQVSKIAQKIDKKAGGNRGVLNIIYKIAMKAIRSSCKTEEEFDAKCQEFLDTACAQMGEENREFYMKYMEEMKAEMKQSDQ